MNVFELFGSIAIKGGDDANRQIDHLDKNGKKASKSVGNLEKVTVAAGKAMKIAFIGAAAAIGLVAVGLTKAVSEAADLEQITTAYEVLIGDVEKAGKVIADIKKASAKTPFQFKDLAKQGQTLMAFGIEADIVVDKMMMLGDVSMGNSVKMESIVRAYGKIQAKGKASLEELNMLTENGVPILGALSEQYGVTTEEMFKMITAGTVGFADVDQALQNMTSEGGKFYGMLDKQSKTFSGRISTLKDNLTLLFAEVGSKLLPVLGPIVDTMITKIQTALEQLTSGTGPLAKFTEVLVKIIAWAVNNIPKIGRTFQFVGEVAAIVADGIKIVWDKLAATVQGIIESLGIDKVIGAVIDVAIEFVGDTYKALKKGLDTGDWSDLFGKAVDLSKVLITIYAGVALAKNFTAGLSTLFTGIVTAFAGTSLFATTKGIGIGGVVAAVSLAVAIYDTVQDPEKGWGALAANVGAALAGGFAVGVLTGNPANGFMVFSILLSFDVGEKLGVLAADVKEAAGKITESISAGINGTELDDDVYGTAEGWGVELAKSIKIGMGELFEKDDDGTAKGWGAKIIEGIQKGTIFDNIWTDLATSFDTNWTITSANIVSAWNDTVAKGKVVWNQIVDDLETTWSTASANALMFGSRIVGSIVSGLRTGEEKAIKIGSDIWDWIKEGFGSFATLGEDIIQGLIDGFNKKKQDVIDWFTDIWAGIKGVFSSNSPSKEAEKLGQDIDLGLINGFNKSKKGIIDWWDYLWNEEIKWGIFGSHSIPKEATGLGEDLGTGVAIGMENPDIVTRLTEAAASWWDAISAPGTMNPDEILGNIFDIFGGAEEGLEELAAGAETFWDRIVAAASESGVSVADLSKKWRASLGSMLTDVYNFVVETGVAFASGTADWETILGSFGTVMGSVLNSVFDAIIAGIVASIIAEDAWLATTLTTIATAVVGFLSLAFAALTAWFAFLGPFAPVAAGVVIAAAIAAIAALGILAVNAIFPAAADTPEPDDLTPDSDLDTNTATGGRQISEITGPTRDLLVDLLTPLARLDSLTSIGNRIYDLLDERLVPGGNSGVTIESLVIYGDSVDPVLTARQIEEALGENLNFAQVGNL